MKNYGVAKGQIYVAADGGQYGHVTLSEPNEHGDVLVRAFAECGWFGAEPRYIDCFKLAMVRYALTESPPDWVPDEVLSQSRTAGDK